MELLLLALVALISLPFRLFWEVQETEPADDGKWGKTMIPNTVDRESYEAGMCDYEPR